MLWKWTQVLRGVVKFKVYFFWNLVSMPMNLICKFTLRMKERDSKEINQENDNLININLSALQGYWYLKGQSHEIFLSLCWSVGQVDSRIGAHTIVLNFCRGFSYFLNLLGTSLTDFVYQRFSENHLSNSSILSIFVHCYNSLDRC